MSQNLIAAICLLLSIPSAALNSWQLYQKFRAEGPKMTASKWITVAQISLWIILMGVGVSILLNKPKKNDSTATNTNSAPPTTAVVQTNNVIPEKTSSTSNQLLKRDSRPQSATPIVAQPAPKSDVPPQVQISADNNQGNVAGINNGTQIVNQTPPERGFIDPTELSKCLSARPGSAAIQAMMGDGESENLAIKWQKIFTDAHWTIVGGGYSRAILGGKLTGTLISIHGYDYPGPLNRGSDTVGENIQKCIVGKNVGNSIAVVISSNVDPDRIAVQVGYAR